MKLASITLFSLALMGCSRSPPSEWTEIQTDDRPVILFLGDSLTAGYRLDPDDAFPAEIQRRVDAAGLSYRIANAGVSGDTSLDGLNRLDWLLTQPVAMLVLTLGSNDALRGLPLGQTQAHLDAILARTLARYPEVHLVVSGLQMPANLGPAYRGEFERIFPSLAEKYDATLIPFILDGVATDPDLNLADGIHPNPQGHQIIADTVWTAIKPLL